MSNKNLVCLILTFGLALLTIGGAFQAGNIIFGTETIVIWLILYFLMPLAIVAERKAECSVCDLNIQRILKRTIDTKYVFVSFCISLLLAIVFDDYIGYTGGFGDGSETMDLFFVSMITFLSASVSLAVYYSVCKIKIQALKKYGERAEVTVDRILYLHNLYYVSGRVTNPFTGQEVRVLGVTYANSKEEIPKWLSVYFDKNNPDEYYFDTCSWIIEY